MLLREIKNIFNKELNAMYPADEIDSFFSLLIDHYLGLERFVLALQPNLVVLKVEQQPLFEALAQLRNHRPIQYIIGTSNFMDMDFSVDENVLIPRPETEELVRWVIEDQKRKTKMANDRNLRILDIGTGSGCIAISLAKNLYDYEIHALDISADALSVARKNAQGNNENVNFFEADILTMVDASCSYDIIVSNPPYVRDQEKTDMHKNVLDHEPELALFVTDERPLVFYEAIIRFAQRNMTENGSLFLEINQYLKKEMEELLRNHNFTEIDYRKDMFGNDRMIKGIVS